MTDPAKLRPFPSALEELAAAAAAVQETLTEAQITLAKINQFFDTANAIAAKILRLVP